MPGCKMWQTAGTVIETNEKGGRVRLEDATLALF